MYFGVRRMGPELFAGGGVDGDDRAILGQHVHDVVDHQRVEGVAEAVAGGEAPGLFKAADVGAVDLFERGILRRIGGAAVVIPLGMVLGGQEQQRDLNHSAL